MVWIAGGGELRRAPLAGGAATKVVELELVTALAADGADVLAVGDRLWRVSLGATTPQLLAEGVDGELLAVAGDAIVVAGAAGIVRVPRGGGAPVVLVDTIAAGVVTALAVADGFVYWADHGIKPPRRNVRTACPIVVTLSPEGEVSESTDCHGEPRDGAIWRVAIAGGAPALVAGGQFGPVGVGVRGAHVYWTSDDGEALMRAPLGGGKPEVLLRGRGAALAIDDVGAIVQTGSGLVVEAPATGKAARVRSVYLTAPTVLALTGDEILTTDVEGGRVVALRRGASRLTVLATPRGSLEALAVAGDRIVYLDAHRDEDRDDRVISVGTRGQLPRVISRTRGDDLRIGVDGDRVAFADALAETVAIGGAAPLVSDAVALAVALDGDTVYWVDGYELRAIPVGGGEPRTLYAPEGHGYGTSGGPPLAHIVAHDGVVHAAGFSLAAFIRADRDGARVLVDAVDDFAPAGGGDFVLWSSEIGLVTYPGAQVLVSPEQAQINAAASDGTSVWMLWYDDDGAALARMPLAGGTPEILLRGVGYGSMVFADDAIFILSTEHDVLLRLAI